MSYVVPALIIAILLCGLVRKVNVYDSFVAGVKQSFDLAMSVFPYLVAMFVMVNALKVSGVGQQIVKVLSPPFALVGIPSELVELMLLRPFSGSGSLAILSDVYTTYGVDSYVGRCASVIMGSCETVFYVASVYFAQTKVKHTGWAIPIALFCNLVGGIASCMLCKVL